MGKSANNWDVYVFTPTGHRLRSTPEILRFLDANPEVKCNTAVVNTQKPPEILQESSATPFSQLNRKRKLSLADPITPPQTPAREPKRRRRISKATDKVEKDKNDNTKKVMPDKNPKRKSKPKSLKGETKIVTKCAIKTKKKSSLKPLTKEERISLRKAKYRNMPDEKKQFVCDYMVNKVPCAIRFAREIELKAHQIKHRPGRPFKCNTCKRKYRRITVLRRHVDKGNCKPPEAANTDDEPEIGNNDDSELNNHKVDDSTGSPSLPSPDCETVQVEQSEKPKKKRLQCFHCPFATEDPNTMVSHYSKVHLNVDSMDSIGNDQDLEEDEIDDVEPEIDNVKEDKKNDSIRRKVICDTCRREFDNFYAWKNHYPCFGGNAWDQH